MHRYRKHRKLKIRQRQAKTVIVKEILQMILSDTLNQPFALAIYAIIGIIFGIMYSANNFACSFLIKSKIFRHITQVGYVLLYSISYFAVTYKYFDYEIKIYQLIISMTFTVGTSLLLYLPIKRHRKVITDKCDAFADKVQHSKLARKFKK